VERKGSVHAAKQGPTSRIETKPEFAEHRMPAMSTFKWKKKDRSQKERSTFVIGRRRFRKRGRKKSIAAVKVSCEHLSPTVKARENSGEQGKDGGAE